MNYKTANKNLKRKGFRKEEKKHHTYYYYYDAQDMKHHKYFYQSHGVTKTDEIPNNFINNSIKTLGLLNKKDVICLFDCTLSESDYFKLITN